mmetsp:Transcript_59616/g.194501  ORF Transcript_59616/g.194501 Transcript_59616/m.194501 type:complete len:547 (+) Transcript_59616:65-1705(+)
MTSHQHLRTSPAKRRRRGRSAGHSGGLVARRGVVRRGVGVVVRGAAVLVRGAASIGSARAAIRGVVCFLLRVVVADLLSGGTSTNLCGILSLFRLHLLRQLVGVGREADAPHICILDVAAAFVVHNQPLHTFACVGNRCRSTIGHAGICEPAARAAQLVVDLPARLGGVVIKEPILISGLLFLVSNRAVEQGLKRRVDAVDGSVLLVLRSAVHAQGPSRHFSSLGRAATGLRLLRGRRRLFAAWRFGPLAAKTDRIQVFPQLLTLFVRSSRLHFHVAKSSDTSSQFDIAVTSAYCNSEQGFGVEVLELEVPTTMRVVLHLDPRIVANWCVLYLQSRATGRSRSRRCRGTIACLGRRSLLRFLCWAGFLRLAIALLSLFLLCLLRLRSLLLHHLFLHRLCRSRSSSRSNSSRRCRCSVRRRRRCCSCWSSRLKCSDSVIDFVPPSENLILRQPVLVDLNPACPQDALGRILEAARLAHCRLKLILHAVAREFEQAVRSFALAAPLPGVGVGRSILGQGCQHRRIHLVRRRKLHPKRSGAEGRDKELT